MKRVALIVAMLWSVAAQAQQGWSDNQIAQDVATSTAYSLGFPGVYSWSTVPAGASIWFKNNSTAVYDAIIQTSDSAATPRFYNLGGGDILIGANSGDALLAAGGLTRIVVHNNGDMFTGLSGGGSLSAPGLASASAATGFFYVGTTCGTPTGTPPVNTDNGTSAVSMIPLVFDACGKLLYWYDYSPTAQWRSIGTGTVTSVSATAPLFITGGASPTPNVVGHDLIFGGASTTGGQNLGSISTAPLGCVTSGGDCVVDGLTLAGGLHFDTGTGTESLANFTCSAGQAVNAATTGGGLACTPVQAPLTACTDYVSVSCQGGTSDIGTGGSNSAVQNIAIHETSGPARLTIGAIPTTGYNLIRSGTSVVGVNPQTQSTATKLQYYIQDVVSSAFLTGSGWVPTSSFKFGLAGATSETPNDFLASHVDMKFYLQTTVGAAGLVTCSVTMNGGVLAGTSITFTPGTTTTPVILDNGVVATGSASANDTYGVFCSGTTLVTGAILVFGIQVLLTA